MKINNPGYIFSRKRSPSASLTCDLLGFLTGSFCSSLQPFQKIIKNMDDFENACCEVHIPTKTSSASKAVVKASGRGRKRKQLTVVEGTTKLHDSSSSFSVDGWERREIFQEQWSKIEEKLLEETSAFFGRYVKLLCDFICRYSGDDDINHQQVGFNFGMMPVAMIALNSKMTQARIHLEVDEMLKSSQNRSNISRLCLNSFNCASMSTLLQAFFQSLISDEVCEENDLEANHWKNMSFDEVIQLWQSSAGKEEENSTSTSSLVIFVFDFESVNKQTLLSLILILKEHLKTTPISFIFFLSNQHNRSLHYYLPTRATDCLAVEDIEPFYEPALIPRLLETLITDETIHFKLHPSLLRPLAAHFTNYEFTFANFFALLKSLVFDFFYSNPLSVVCPSVSTGDLKTMLKGNRPLLRLLQNSVPLVETIPSSGDDDESGEVYMAQLEAQLDDLHCRHARFTYNLQILIDLLKQAHCLQASEVSQQSHFLTYYCETIATDLSFSEDFLSPLLRVPDTTWRLALRRVIARYKEGEEDTPELITLFIEYQNKLGELLRKEAEEEEEMLKRNKALGLEIDMVNVKAVKEKLRNVRSRTEWRQSMLPKAISATSASTTKKDLRPFEQWKTDLLEAIDALLCDTSPAFYRLLIDQLFYNNLEYVREHHFVCIRDRLAKSLSQSGSDGNLRSFTNIYPNSFILYQLYREAEPVVNLADWYEAFCEEKNRKTSKGSKKLKDSSTPLSSDELTVHFSSTLSDFDYIGLLTSSRYKADYLNKLAWF